MIYIAQLLIYIVIHFAAGRLGVFLNNLSSGEFVFFWPVVGISLAALLLYGYRFLPGIFLGSLLVNLSTGTQYPIALIAAIGGSLSPFIATYIMKHFFKFELPIEKTRDIIALTLIAFPINTIMLASFLTVGLVLNEIMPPSEIPFIWASFGISNFISMVVITTFLLVWIPNPKIKMKNLWNGERILFLITLAVLGVLMFTNVLDKTTSIAYLIFLPLVWSALRFGLRETVTVIFFFSVLSMWSTFLGYGPLTTPNLTALLLYFNINAELLYLQSFISFAAIISMILAISVSERKELEQRKDNFISIASHELKTPLTSLKIMAQHLSKMSATERKKEEANYFVNMDHQINKLTHLTNDLLDLSKIQQKQMGLRKESILLNDLLLDSVKTIQMSSSTHTISVEEEDTYTIWGDRDYLSQVFNNLLSNAIKYSPQAKKIIVTITSDVSNVLVSVQDFGIGIKKNKLNRLFERFYRAHNEDENTFSGFGLGLYISSEIIKKHGGSIWAESEQGKGSTFYVKLPLKQKGGTLL